MATTGISQLAGAFVVNAKLYGKEHIVILFARVKHKVPVPFISSFITSSSRSSERLRYGTGPLAAAQRLPTAAGYPASY
jgi:hypothetical protein